MIVRVVDTRSYRTKFIQPITLPQTNNKGREKKINLYYIQKQIMILFVRSSSFHQANEGSLL